MHRDQTYFLLLNIGHFLDHLFMLVFATVAALALRLPATRCVWRWPSSSPVGTLNCSNPTSNQHVEASPWGQNTVSRFGLSRADPVSPHDS